MSDNEARARELATTLESGRSHPWEKVEVVDDVLASAICAALDAAEARERIAGRIAGIREARVIADELDPGTGSAIERDMNEDRDNELIAALDARLASLTTETTETAE